MVATILPDGSIGSSSAPFSLTASTAGRYAPLVEEYKSDEVLHWAGDEDGIEYDDPSSSSHKSNNSVAFYPSFNHTATTLVGPSALSLVIPTPAFGLWLASLSPTICSL